MYLPIVAKGWLMYPQTIFAKVAHVWCHLIIDSLQFLWAYTSVRSPGNFTEIKI